MSHRPRFVATLLGITALALATACNVPAPGATDTLPVGTVSPVQPIVTGGAYGSDPVQLFDLYLPPTPPAGGTPLIIWEHGGGWASGDRGVGGISQALMHELDKGYAVASIDYHLFTQGGTFPVPIQDTKLAVRYFKVHGSTWNLLPDKIFLSGGSAGGYNVSFAAASGPGNYEPSPLPADLAAVDSSVIGVIDMLGPVDLEELGDNGVFGSVDVKKLVTDFLPCPVASDMTSCDPAKLAETMVVPRITASTPPMYLVYGGIDTLVPPATHGQKIDDAFTSLNRGDVTWFDVPAAANHSLVDQPFLIGIDTRLNLTYMDGWIGAVAAGTLA